MSQPTSTIPYHVALIPDGNRRWAKERGQLPWEGHDAGAKNTEQIVEKARELGVRMISFWGSSLENMAKRPLDEKRELLRIYETYFVKLIENESVHRDGVRIRMLGRWREQFPDTLKQLLIRCEEETKTYTEYGLNFFLAYSGDDEMLSAVRSLISSGIRAEDISMETLKQSLLTRVAASRLSYSDRWRAAFVGRVYDVGYRECPALFFREVLSRFWFGSLCGIPRRIRSPRPQIREVTDPHCI